MALLFTLSFVKKIKFCKKLLQFFNLLNFVFFFSTHYDLTLGKSFIFSLTKSPLQNCILMNMQLQQSELIYELEDQLLIQMSTL